MNCQWQSLACQVESGVLNMFADEEKDERGEVKRERSPQYTVQLRGCEVRAGPDTHHSFRITLSMLGDQVAVLEVGVRQKTTPCSLNSFTQSCPHSSLSSFRSVVQRKRSDGWSCCRTELPITVTMTTAHRSTKVELSGEGGVYLDSHSRNQLSTVHCPHCFTPIS